MTVTSYEAHPEYVSILAVLADVRTAVYRARSRLGDVVHYVNRSQWEDAKTALDEVGELKRRLNELWRKASDLDAKIRSDVEKPG